MTTTPREPTDVIAEAGRRVAEQFIADNLGDQIGAGTPWRVVSPLRSAVVIPLVLTSPGYGVVGTVGVLIVDEELNTLTAWTPLEEIRATAARPVREHDSERRAAWERVQFTGPA